MEDVVIDWDLTQPTRIDQLIVDPPRGAAAVGSGPGDVELRVQFPSGLVHEGRYKEVLVRDSLFYNAAVGNEPWVTRPADGQHGFVEELKLNNHAVDSVQALNEVIADFGDRWGIDPVEVDRIADYLDRVEQVAPAGDLDAIGLGSEIRTISFRGVAQGSLEPHLTIQPGQGDLQSWVRLSFNPVGADRFEWDLSKPTPLEAFGIPASAGRFAQDAVSGAPAPVTIELPNSTLDGAATAAKVTFRDTRLSALEPDQPVERLELSLSPLDLDDQDLMDQAEARVVGFCPLSDSAVTEISSLLERIDRTVAASTVVELPEEAQLGTLVGCGPAAVRAQVVNGRVVLVLVLDIER